MHAMAYKVNKSTILTKQFAHEFIVHKHTANYKPERKPHVLLTPSSTHNCNPFIRMLARDELIKQMTMCEESLARCERLQEARFQLETIQAKMETLGGKIFKDS